MSENAVPIDEWHGCYDDSWKGLITDESFAHPAKFARGLIARIYQHIAEEGWAGAGDVVVDPFGGIGLGGLGAMISGMHWIGSELEPRFVSLGDHCDCTGISPADWVRFFGRWSRVAYSGGRRWCPQCLAEAESVLESVQLSLFGQPPSASYVRNSGKIPGTDPHHYAGNIELWRRKGYPGTAQLLQGDSRDLINVVRQAGLISPPAMGIASPPYMDRSAADTHVQGCEAGDLGMNEGETYGENPGNLGNLPPGDLAATISSPPYNLPMSQEHPGRGGGERGTTPAEPGAFCRYGDTPGQLEGLPMGEPPTLNVVASPPYVVSQPQKSDDGIDLYQQWLTYRKTGGMGYDAFCAQQRKFQAGYGDTPGQLANLRAGDVAAAISSPPYAGALGNAKDYTDEERARADAGRDIMHDKAGKGNDARYSPDPRNLGNLPPGDVATAISSPPYLQAQDGGGIAKKGTPAQLNECPGGHVSPVAPMGYADNTPGQLGAMPEGDLSISSPPWEQTEGQNAGRKWADPEGSARARAQGYASGRLKGHYASEEAILAQLERENQYRYGDTAGNMGNQAGETFWSAARAIVEQVFRLMRPGSHAIWVVKAFVRDGKLVDFPGQWRTLCESAGFVTIHEHHAMLTEQKGIQIDLDGKLHERKIERKSFFRRLTESKGSPKVDYEVVWCMVRP